jgi:hypothetical protein
MPSKTSPLRANWPSSCWKTKPLKTKNASRSKWSAAGWNDDYVKKLLGVSMRL